MALRLTPSTEGGFAVVRAPAARDHEPQEYAQARDLRAEADAYARKASYVGAALTALILVPGLVACAYTFKLIHESDSNFWLMAIPVIPIVLVLSLVWSIVGGMAGGRLDDAEFLADLYEQVGRGDITEHQAMVLIQQRRQIQLEEAQLAALTWANMRAEMHHYQQMGALNRISRKL